MAPPARVIVIVYVRSPSAAEGTGYHHLTSWPSRAQRPSDTSTDSASGVPGAFDPDFQDAERSEMEGRREQGAVTTGVEERESGRDMSSSEDCSPAKRETILSVAYDAAQLPSRDSAKRMIEAEWPKFDSPLESVESKT